MKWKELGENLAKAGLPLVGAAIGGPGGAAIGAAIASTIGSDGEPNAILETLTSNQDALLKAKQFELTHQETLLKLTLDYEVELAKVDSANTSSVNSTIQVEAQSVHWPTYSWRPFIGFCFGIDLLVTSLTVCTIYILVICGISEPDLLQFIPGFLSSMAALLAVPMPILGIASWFRGKMQADPNIPTDNRG